MFGALILIGVLVLLYALFSVASTAQAALSLGRLRELAGEGKKGARALLRWRERPQRFFVGQRAASLLFVVPAALIAGLVLAPRLAAWWSEGRAAETGAASFFSALVLVLLIVLLFLGAGELAPRAIALRKVEHWALRAGPFLRFCLQLSLPLASLGIGLARLILWPLRLLRAPFVIARNSPERLRRLGEEAIEQGTLDPIIGGIALRAIDFRETKAAEVMVPRNRVVAIPLEASSQEIQRLALEEGHARMPVYDETIDDVVGYVLQRDLYALAWSGEQGLRELVRPAYFVPETLRAAQLLQEMQERRIGIAIVVEESGGMAGIVTLEDLVEELVGELFTEGEEDVPQPIRKGADGSAFVLGITAVRDVNRELGLDLPEGEGWTTVAGLCIALAGRIPEKGSCLPSPDGSQLEVVEATPRRVRVVRIVPPR